MHVRTWTVEIMLSEEEGITRARASLSTDDTHGKLQATGVARKNPTDRDLPEIGDELAGARALSALAHALLDTAAQDIEGVEHHSVHLTG